MHHQSLSTSSLQHGNGRITVSSHASAAVFTELSSTYPLKLLSPSITSKGIAVVYILNYGGGLIGGDEVSLSVDVQKGANLLVLSQGSTKVFKTRLGTRLSSQHGQLRIKHEAIITTQNMQYRIEADGALFLLPDPVTCFRAASYHQTQTFDLGLGASLVLLDWITSGRQSLGEEWDFSRYYSANEVRTDGRLVAKDILFLEKQGPNHQEPSRTIRDRLAPYSCYAMVLLYGPRVQDTVDDIWHQYGRILVFQTKLPANVIWSFSHLGDGSGAVVRVAGKETEMVRDCLREILRRLDKIIGLDDYRRAFL